MGILHRLLSGLDVLQQAFSAHMYIVFLIYGAAFMIMGVAVFIYPNKAKSRLLLGDSLWLLALFGVLHGANEWLDMIALLHGARHGLDEARTLTLITSFIPLLEFGRRAWLLRRAATAAQKRLFLARGRWVVPAACALVLAVSVFSGECMRMGGLVARYLLCFPGAMLAGLGLLGYRNSDPLLQEELDVRRPLAWMAYALLFYGLLSGLVVPRAGFPPACWINVEGFLAVFHIPVQVLRAGCAVAIAYGMIRTFDVLDWEQRKRMKGLLDGEIAARRSLHSIVEKNPAGVCVATTEGRILYMNVPAAAFMEMIREAEGRFPRDFTVGVFEHAVRRADGTNGFCEIIVTATDWEGQEARLLTILDVSERKKSDERIRAMLREKEVLLREVHHRVKNNLQTIIHLTEMRGATVRSATIQRFLQELRGQARAMALVYEQLYRAENLARVALGPYIESLCGNVMQSFGREADARLSLDIQDLSLEVERALPCGLIINELLTNSLKHAFPKGRFGTVHVALKAEGERVVLRVEDDGVGLPEGLDWETSESLGLKLVRLWARHQLGGSFSVESKGGTRFLISFEGTDAQKSPPVSAAL